MTGTREALVWAGASPGVPALAQQALLSHRTDARQGTGTGRHAPCQGPQGCWCLRLLPAGEVASCSAVGLCPEPVLVPAGPGC